jgi:hypothetical protein
MAPDESRPFIIGALQIPEYRMYALRAMQEGDVEELLESPHLTAAGGITATLGSFVGEENIFDEAVVAVLSKCLRHSSRYVRTASLRLLTAYGGQGQEDMLMALISEENNHRLRERLIDILSRSDSPAIRKFLQDVACDADEPLAVRARALAYSARHDPDLVIRFCWELLDFAEREYLQGPQRDRWPLDLPTRVAISAAIAAAADRALESAARGLHHKSALVRETTCYGLGRSSNPGAALLLSECLSDDDPRIQRAAVWGLGQLRHAESAPLVKRRLDALSSNVRLR